jgi:hypothetical protein
MHMDAWKGAHPVAEDDVIIRTESGMYKVPPGDLERYRVEEGDVEGFAFDFGLNQLRPDSTVRLRIGTQAIVQQRGHIILSGETKADV